MREDEDEVGFDLSAWEAPPPPSGIADAVIARVTAPTAAGAVEATPPRLSRWWIAGGIAAVTTGAISIALLARGGEEVTGGSGAVATAKPSHLEVGGTAIDLEANTDLWWLRDGSRMTAMQPRGSATYKVAAGDELRIDAGATVASVSASGASLRVEVDMNLSDARLIGASAGTAAAIALVTVIVYEGHVKVTGNDRTVEVAAGSTVQIAPNKPPVEPALVSGREQRLEAKIKFLELENQLLRDKIAGNKITVEHDAVMGDFEKVIAAAAPEFKKCGDGETPKVQGVIVVDRGAKPRLDFEEPYGHVGACLVSVVAELKFSPATEGAFEHAWTFPVKAPARPPTPSDSTPACNNGKTNEMERKGDDAISSGSWATALAIYESILACRPAAVGKAYMAACRGHNFPKAKALFQQMRKQGRSESFAQICIRDGFDPR